MIEGRNTGVSSLWKGVNHIALVVSDVGRSVAFYGGVLGMKQVGVLVNHWRLTTLFSDLKMLC